tara:strand:- start:120 stop:497 length:378 start_codon:yes stop_codon:yes gene_type:complete
MIDPVKVRQDVNGIINERKRWKNNEDYHGFTKKEFGQVMVSKYPYLSDNSRTMFEKCIDGEMEQPDQMEKLEYMLSMLERVQGNQHSYENVSKEIGQKFADEYVKPLVDKLDKEKEEKKNKKGKR